MFTNLADLAIELGPHIVSSSNLPIFSEAQQIEDKLPKVRQAKDEGRRHAGCHVQGRGHAVVVFHFHPGDLDA